MAIKQRDVSEIKFQTELFKIGEWTILKLPKDASAKLPSRGMVMVKGRVNGAPFKTPLEPDGKGSHWFRVGKDLLKIAGDTVEVVIEPSNQWPEPDVPVDLRNALAADRPARDIWSDITPMARWDWIRWIRATNSAETRDRRIKVSLSKLKSGTRRPCCFNRTVCTDPSVSKSGVLLEPTSALA